jgi:hypothetical protein
MSYVETDILISRVVDGEATDDDWAQLADRAANTPEVWRDAAEAQRDHASMRIVVGEAARRAERIDTPTPSRVPWVRVGGWAGWAVAAVITLVWAMRFVTPVPPEPGSVATPAGNPGPVVAPAPAPGTAADAMRQYLDAGPENATVVSEIPTKVLLESRPLPDGGYELLYLRQFLERAVVDDLYELNGRNERGDPELVRWQKPVRQGPV